MSPRVIWHRSAAHFVGRRKELRSLRRALREHTPIYVRGIGGIGKTTLIAKLLDRPGTDLDGVCVIRCHELSQPVDALNKIASFWQAQGMANHAEAAALLLDSRLDPADARQALQLIANAACDRLRQP
jgi:Cdc6-like AAA superfamily ATPase